MRVRGGGREGLTAPVDIPGLPIVAQVLLEQIARAKTGADRLEIHGRMASYVAEFTGHDVPSSAVEALNDALARYRLPPVTAPVSAAQARFERMVAEELRVTKEYSGHTGRYHEISNERRARRGAFIENLHATVKRLGASMTSEELADAARILTLGLSKL